MADPRDTPVIDALQAHGIAPSAQRLAIARFVLQTDAHPSADQVWSAVRAELATVSRATVYNTLHLFVQKGLLRELVLTEGKVVFDPKLDRHHHLIDEDTGTIHDIPWEAVPLTPIESVESFAVHDMQIVMRGRRKE